MLPSQFNSSAGNDLVDQPSYRYASDGHHYPSKRVRRLFYDPERVISTDRIFSEYDWHTHTFSSTLRIPPSRQTHSPCSRQDMASDATVVSKNTHEWKSKIGQSRVSSRLQSCCSQVPDETLVSSYLLSTSNSISSSSSSNTEPDTWHSHIYSTSPISHEHSSQSPLQQSIMAYAELDHESGTRAFHPPASARTGKQPQEQKEDKTQTLYSHNLKRPRHASSTEVGMPSDAEAAKEMGIAMPLGKKRQSRHLFSGASVACVSLCPSSPELPSTSRSDPPFSSAPPLVLESIDCLPKRQSSAQDKRARAHILSRGTFYSDSIDRRNGDLRETYVQNDGYPDASESLALEDEVDERSPKEEGRLSILVSALHYQYVSVNLRIRLAVHRAEKVARRLGDKRRKRDYVAGL